MNERRRLFVDIETSPLQVFVWSLNDKANQYISHKSIVHDRGIICICWKWAGDKTVHHLTWNKRQCDKAMLKAFVKVLESATEIVAHNGDRFDIPWIRGRCLVHEIPMSPSYPQVDTLKKARQKFRLPSSRLDYLGETLVGEQKLATGFGLWRDIVLDKSESAMGKMIRYCKNDVKLLEKVFDKIQPYIEHKTSVARYLRDCPECGESKHYKNDWYMKNNGQVMYKLCCANRLCRKTHVVSKTQYDKNKKFNAA